AVRTRYAWRIGPPGLRSRPRSIPWGVPPCGPARRSGVDLDRQRSIRSVKLGICDLGRSQSLKPLAVVLFYALRAKPGLKHESACIAKQALSGVAVSRSQDGVRCCKMLQPLGQIKLCLCDLRT